LKRNKILLGNVLVLRAMDLVLVLVLPLLVFTTSLVVIFHVIGLTLRFCLTSGINKFIFWFELTVLVLVLRGMDLALVLVVPLLVFDCGKNFSEADEMISAG